MVKASGGCSTSRTGALRSIVKWFVGFPDSEPLEGAYPKNHAARGETSLQLFFKPKLVDLTLLPADREATLDDDGVWGEDPRKASAAEGAQMLQVFLGKAVPKIRKLLQTYHNTSPARDQPKL
jgi:creatinine amidohydrolase/Fe(II)-dependent formamide hydrolase-like protein